MSEGWIRRVRWAASVAIVLLAVVLTGCGRLASHAGENPPSPASSTPTGTPGSGSVDEGLDSVGADLDAADGAARQADSDGAAGDANASTDDAP